MKSAFATVLLLVSVGMVGCSANQQFVQAIDGYAAAILPEYETYIRNDTTLSEDTKRIRLQSSDGMRNLINEAKGAQ